jgi:hypothetical protein
VVPVTVDPFVMGCGHPGVGLQRYEQSSVQAVVPVAHPSGILLYMSRVLRQLLRDAQRTDLDLRPVTDVAFGHHRASCRELSQRLLGEGEPAGIESTEEDVVVSGRIASRNPGIS